MSVIIHTEYGAMQIDADRCRSMQMIMIGIPEIKKEWEIDSLSLYHVDYDSSCYCLAQEHDTSSNFGGLLHGGL